MLDLTNPYRDDAWPTVEVDEQSPHDSPDEPMGSKTKFWVRVNSKGETRPWLFKFARVKDGEVRGEDWAEVLVHRLAGLIDIPTALVVPATYRGRRGVLSRHMLGRLAEELVHGNELLAAFHPDYEPLVERENAGYTVEAIQASLVGFGITHPEGLLAPPEADGFDAIAWYLTLDAWVAAQDRHHENWAAIVGGGLPRLAPSFDHGNALGFQESDMRIAKLLRDPTGIRRWVERGHSHHFAGRPVLVDLAHEALAASHASVRETLLGRLSGVNFEEVEQIVRGVPRTILSEAKASFVVEVLKENRRRLVDGY